jgi:hypothetical protein
MYIGLHVKYALFLTDFNKIISRQICEKSSSNFVKMRPVGAGSLHASSGSRVLTCVQWEPGPYMRTVGAGSLYASSGSRVLTCGQWEPGPYMRTDRQTDLTKVIVAFRNFCECTSKRQRRVTIVGPARHKIRFHQNV